jgi:hypothetical protein
VERKIQRIEAQLIENQFNHSQIFKFSNSFNVQRLLTADLPVGRKGMQRKGREQRGEDQQN